MSGPTAQDAPVGFVARGGPHFRAGDADEEDVVAGDFKRHVVGERDIFAGPEVLGLLGAVEAELGEVEVEGMRAFDFGHSIPVVDAAE